MVRIIVCGAAGRVGSSIIRLAKDDADMQVAGALESRNNPAIGAGKPPITDDISKVLAKDTVVIDFTTPAATLEHLAAAEKAGAAMVIGTTGFSPAEIEKITAAAKKIPVVFSPNMSVGVNLLFRLAEEVSTMVPGYDIEIVELHHNQKKDAPSGTAMKLAQIIAKALGRDMKKSGVYGREGAVGARTKDEIGVLAVRAGDIVGEHTVYFAGPGERIELTHRAHSRDNFAVGALRAAKWLSGRTSGLYDMQDVLGLKNR